MHHALGQSRAWERHLHSIDQTWLDMIIWQGFPCFAFQFFPLFMGFSHFLFVLWFSLSCFHIFSSYCTWYFIFALCSFTLFFFIVSNLFFLTKASFAFRLSRPQRRTACLKIVAMTKCGRKGSCKLIKEHMVHFYPTEKSDFWSPQLSS